MKKTIFLIFGIILFSYAAIAASPGTPCGYYGDVTVDSVTSSDAVVDAYISSVLRGTTFVGEYNPDTYSITVTRPDSEASNDVDMKVWGIDAGTVTFVALDVIEEDLSVDKITFGNTCPMDYTGITKATPTNYEHEGCAGDWCVHDICRNTSTYCGDTFIDTPEECEGTNFNGQTCSNYGYNSGSLSCSAANCKISSSGCYNSGGGGGGGGGGSVCTPFWNCTDWTDCVNEQQTRTCVDTKDCGFDGPPTTQTCEEEQQTLEGMVNDQVDNETLADQINDDLGPLSDLIEGSDDFTVTTDPDDIEDDFGDDIDQSGTDIDDVNYVATFTLPSSIFTPNDPGNDYIDEYQQKLLEMFGIDVTLDTIPSAVKEIKITIIGTDEGIIIKVEFIYEVGQGSYLIDVPKDIAESADLLVGEFEVIESDPVLLFRDTDEVSFAVFTQPQNVDELEAKSDEVIILELEAEEELPQVEEEAEEEVSPITGEVVADDEQPTYTPKPWMGIIIIILVVVIGGVLIYSMLPPRTADQHYKKAAKLHRKAENNYRNGKSQKAETLYKKAQTFREKGERLHR